MKFMTRLLLAAFLLTTATLWVPAASEASTNQIFAAPDENGKITRLDLKARELVVGDTLFRLSSSVAVYTHRGFQTTVGSLRKGMRIAFNVTQDTTGSPSIHVIWILSKR